MALCLAAGTVQRYAAHGFGGLTVCLWLGGMLVGIVALMRSAPAPVCSFRFSWRDARTLALLLLLLSPIYLWQPLELPRHVYTDELSFVHHARTLLSRGDYDFFALSPHYFGWPNGCFICTAMFQRLLGGVSLEHARCVHALAGLAAVGLFFVLLRQTMARRWALAGALLLAFVHSFVMLSRLGLRDNFPVVLELCVLLLMHAGIRSRSSAWFAAAGAVAGLGFYNYYTGRAIIVMGVAGLACLGRAAHPTRTRTDCMRWMLAVLFGFLLSAAPAWVAHRENGAIALAYLRGQSVLFDVGRREIQRYDNQSDEVVGVAVNALRGITALNNNMDDISEVYINRGYGIIDPLTGALVWVGVLLTLRRWRRGGMGMLMLAGLGTTLLLIGMLANKNPAYCRLLVVLPFACWFAVHGLRLLSMQLGRFRFIPSSRRFQFGTALAVVAGIALWNGLAVRAHYLRVHGLGDAPGDTLRYVHARPDMKTFAVVSDARRPYFSFGGDFWATWVEQMTQAGQEVRLLVPSGRGEEGTGQVELPAERPCVLLMSAAQWRYCSRAIYEREPGLRLVRVTPQGMQVAVELP